MKGRSKPIFTVIAGLALVAVLVILVIRRDKPPASLKDHSIGVILSLTDRGATYGQRALHGMQLAVDELNTTEPFRTRPIRLIVEDSQSSATQALSAFRKLIDIDHVSVVIGFVLSDEVLTCAPIANERRVVILSTAAGSDQIRDAGDYVFRNRESARSQTDVIAHACVTRLGLVQAAILHSNASNGISYRDSFKASMADAGGSISTTVGYNEGKNDYRAEIEQLRPALPRAVYLAGLDHELGLILKQSREVGFAPQFFASAGAISQKLLEIAGSGAEGLVCGSAPFDAASQDPRIATFASAYKHKFDEAPDFIAANSYDAVQMLAAFFRDGKTDADQIKISLYATRDFPGVGGSTTFDRDGEVTKPISLVVVKNGRFVPMEGD